MKILEIYFAQAYAETCNQEFFLVKDFYEDSFTVPSLGKTTSQEAKEICGSRFFKRYFLKTSFKRFFIFLFTTCCQFAIKCH